MGKTLWPKDENRPKFWCRGSGLLPVGHIKTNIRGGTAGAVGMTHPPDTATQTAGELPCPTHGHDLTEAYKHLVHSSSSLGRE